MKVHPCAVDARHIEIDPQSLLLIRETEQAAIERLAQIGIRPVVTSFRELERLNDGHRNTWRSLFSPFRLKIGLQSEHDGVVLFGIDERGDVVATQAVRIFDWTISDMKTEVESLRFLYLNPDRHKGPEESCVLTCPETENISGIVGLSGAVWYREDMRGRGIVEVFSRLAKVYAYDKLKLDNIISLFGPESVNKRLHQRVGYHNVLSVPIVFHNSPLNRSGTMEMIVAQQTPVELLDDAFAELVYPKING